MSPRPDTAAPSAAPLGPDADRGTTHPAGPRPRPLRWLVARQVLLVALATFVVVAVAVMAARAPAIDDESRQQVNREVRNHAERGELTLAALERELMLLARALPGTSASQAATWLDGTVSDGRWLHRALLLGTGGRVALAGLTFDERHRRDEWLGADLSHLQAVQQCRQSPQASWHDGEMPMRDGSTMVSLALPLADGRCLLAQVPRSLLVQLLHDLPSAADRDELRPTTLWLVDTRGQVLADTAGRAVHRVLPADSALRQPLPSRQVSELQLDIDGARHQVALTQVEGLRWHIVSHTPLGWAHPRIRNTAWLVGGALTGMLLLGLALAPWMSGRLTRGLQRLVDQAQAVERGSAQADWPRGPVHELNQLSDSLASMAGTLQDREAEVALMFNAAPVAMCVTRQQGGVLVNANNAWCRQFGYSRVDVLTRTALDLGLWADLADRDQALQQLAQGDVLLEAAMCRADGSPLLCQVSARSLLIGGQRLVIWAAEDITDQRRAEQALRELNATLEQRVAQRTEALAQANTELRGTLDHLQTTRDELLRAEKQAALGRVVAGVAHELNTPLGNSLMAVSTLRDEARQFRVQAAQGLRRSALDALLDSVDQATTIGTRNLQRAADLVAGFKQVAADRTSAQRRRFDLDEVVAEIVLTLKPGFSRTPYQVETAIAPGLQLDSYPGALGQVLTNLVENARVHGFEGRDHGRVSITAGPLDSQRVQLQVADDGCGISPDLVARVFDPFVTTRRGRGGTGLGLNIAHNAVTRILGGTLEVSSTPGQGSRFTLVLPCVAPHGENEGPPDDR